MRPALLAVSATALLAIGAALSVEAVRSGPSTSPVIAEAVAATPAVNDDASERSVKSAAVPVSQATTAAVVRVKTVRIDAELPAPPATEAEQEASLATEMQPQETAAGALPATSASRDRAAAPKPADSQPVAANDAPPPARARSARTKPQVVAVKRTSHRKHKQEQLAGDGAPKDALGYAPKEKGPESLNPLGKLLSGTR
jgi:hypothetical protein